VGELFSAFYTLVFSVALFLGAVYLISVVWHAGF